ncbi:MoaD/ThiS family protein [Candidatus Bathyarchaeota archaeon]|nr:MoaD/ThiS family protein [Candidatus Bathyarchaeota archaeon]
MRVLVKFVGRPYDLIKVKNIWFYFDNDVEVTLKGLLDKIEAEMGIKFNVGEEGIIALINGRSIDHIGGLHAKLKDLDEVVIASIVGGG